MHFETHFELIGPDSEVKIVAGPMPPDDDPVGRIVAQTSVGRRLVSTVFDPWCGRFETAVWEDDLLEVCCEYDTWREAERGHREIVAKLERGLEPIEHDSELIVVETTCTVHRPERTLP